MPILPRDPPKPPSALGQRLKEVPPGDILILLVFVSILAWAVSHLSDGDSESEQLWLMLAIAAFALVTRYILFLVPEKILGLVPGQVSLAIVSGSIASFLILWVSKQELQPPIIENSSYRVTWTFYDHELADRVKMEYQLVRGRVNRSTKDHLGWENTWFEPYPGIEGIESASVRVAEKESDLTNFRGQVQELPLVTNGFVISLDKSKSSEARAAYLKSGETKWFEVEGTMIVPISYWDIAVGLVALGNPPGFEMIDKTTSGLALILAGPSNEVNLNFNDDGRVVSNKVEMIHSQMTNRPTRAQAYWYPENLLKKSTKKLIVERFKPKDE